MEDRRHMEQTDRKLMRSRSLSNSCDIRLIRSFGSSDQSTSAMEAAILFFSIVKKTLAEKLLYCAFKWAFFFPAYLNENCFFDIQNVLKTHGNDIFVRR